MQENSEAPTTSTSRRFSESGVLSLVEFGVTAGPSLWNIISIRKVSSHREIISYQKSSTFNELNNPVSFHSQSIESVKEKYSNRQKVRADYLEEKLNEMFGKIPFSIENVLNYVETDLILYRLFTTAVYVVNNYFGKRSPKSFDSTDILLYVKKLIPISGTNQKLFSKFANNIRPPEFFVDLKIAGISRTTGFEAGSHFFCKVWIDSEPDRVEMTNVVDGKTVSNLKTQFYFRIKDLKNDAVIVELCETDQRLYRSIDPVSTTLRIRQLFRKFSRKSLKEGDDRYRSLGKIEIRICDIYSEGVNEVIPIADKTQTIYLHFEAKFDLNEPKNRLEGLKRHIMLLRLCVQDRVQSTNNKQEPLSSWEQVLNAPAYTLLFLHSVISSLTPYEELVSKFIVVAHVVLETDFRLKFVYQLLNETQYLLTNSSGVWLEDGLRQNYEDLLKRFTRKCFQFISSLRSYDMGTDRKIFSELEFALRSIYLCMDIIDIDKDPLTTLQLEAIEYLEIKIQNLTQKMNCYTTVHTTLFLNSLMQYLKAVDRVIQNIIPDESLTQALYTKFDEELVVPLQKHAKKSRIFHQNKESQEVLADSVQMEGIELLSEVKNLVGYFSKITKVPEKQLKMANFLLWFDLEVIVDWFKCVRLKAVKDIEEAIERDDLQCTILLPLDDARRSTCMSLSAELTCLTMQKLPDLWTLVSIPRTKTCDEVFLNSLNDCCETYADLMKAESTKLLKEFYVEGKRCICIIANDLWYVHVAAERMIVETVGTLPPHFVGCCMVLKDSYDEMFQLLIDKYIVHIKDIVKSILDEGEAKEGEGPFPLFVSFLNKVVWQEISEHMKLKVFLMFLQRMSDHMIQVLRDCMDDDDIPTSGKKDEQFYRTLIKILNATTEVCNIPGSLKENDGIWGEDYINLVHDLEQNVVYLSSN